MTLVVTVCKLAENGRTKCHKFWPDEDSKSDEDFEMLVEDMVITTVSKKSLGKFLQERVFEVSDSQGNKILTR